MTQDNLVIQKIFSDAVLKCPDKIALQIKKDNRWFRLTYKELEAEAFRIANFLLKAGFKKQDFAALILENRPEWAIIYLGIMYAGLTCIPLDVQLNSQDLKNFLLDSSAKLLFCSQDIFQKKITPDIQEILTYIIVLDAKDIQTKNCIDFSQIENFISERANLPSVESQDIASLIYTSGTTGKPKGVMLTHRNICSNFMSVRRLNICFDTDNILALLPFHHTYPFMVTLMLPLFLGAKITFCPLGFKPEDLSNIMREEGVTILVGVPQLFSLIHSAVFQRLKKIPPPIRFVMRPIIKRKVITMFGKSLRMLVSGGARLDPKIASGLRWLGFKIIEGYGLTETSPIVTLNPPVRVKIGSVGIPIPDVQIKINNPDRQGIGEVLIKGPNVMKGYYQQPELTASVVKDDWFYSGDLGYIDKDRYLFLTGREKDVIVLSSGKNIYLEEMEEYYLKSPYIKEICILEKRQERFGHEVESLYAVVVPNFEYFQQRKESNIQGKVRWELENLAKDLPSYKHIMGFTVTQEELPRTTLKKIKRYQVKQKFLEEKIVSFEPKEKVLSAEDLEIFNQEVAKKIIHYLSEQLKKPVSLDSHLELDLGIDSLTRVELGLGLERLFLIKVPEEVLYTVSTVKDVILKIMGLVNKIAEGQTILVDTTQKTWSQILKERPQGAVLKKIKLKPSLLDILLTLIFKQIFSFIFRIFWLLRIKGKDSLPKKGPFIICPNHASYLDAFVVLSSLPFKLSINTYFLGYSAIFEQPLIRWAIKFARLIPIDPSVHLTEAMQAVSFVLSQQKIVCIFPEGRRSIDENIQDFKKGIGILIKELDMPVVPAYLKGSHYSWPRTSHLPRFYPLKIIFGRLFSPKSTSDDYQTIANALREQVLRLIC